jgi:hypothetical protein
MPENRETDGQLFIISICCLETTVMIDNSCRLIGLIENEFKE